jgi:hypothetical protein
MLNAPIICDFLFWHYSMHRVIRHMFCFVFMVFQLIFLLKELPYLKGIVVWGGAPPVESVEGADGKQVMVVVVVVVVVIMTTPPSLTNIPSPTHPTTNHLHPRSPACHGTSSSNAAANWQAATLLSMLQQQQSSPVTAPPWCSPQAQLASPKP